MQYIMHRATFRRFHSLPSIPSPMGYIQGTHQNLGTARYNYQDTILFMGPSTDQSCEKAGLLAAPSFRPRVRSRNTDVRATAY